LLLRIAECIISKPLRLNNKEVRYLRKYIGIKATYLAKKLHVDKSTISRWEAGAEKIGTANDRLLRLIAIRYKEEQQLLLFPGKIINKLEAIDPNARIKKSKTKCFMTKIPKLTPIVLLRNRNIMLLLYIRIT